MLLKNLVAATQVEAYAAKYARKLTMVIDHAQIAHLRRQLLITETKQRRDEYSICKSFDIPTPTEVAKVGAVNAVANVLSTTSSKKLVKTKKPDLTPEEAVKKSHLFLTARMALDDYGLDSTTWEDVKGFLRYNATRRSDTAIIEGIATIAARHRVMRGNYV